MNIIYEIYLKHEILLKNMNYIIIINLLKQTHDG